LEESMKEKLRSAVILSLTIVVLLFTSSRLPADTGTCGGAMTSLPFTDVAGNGFFCQIAEAYFSGLTNGTTSTTYSPSDNVPRQQMAAFITRTQDSALRRGSRRAALGQWSFPNIVPDPELNVGGDSPTYEVKSDGENLWIANSSSVTRVRASDAKLLDTFTDVTNAYGVLVARGRIWVTGQTNPGHLYRITPGFHSPSEPIFFSGTLGNGPRDLATDGAYIWTANTAGGSISQVHPVTAVTTTLTAGFVSPVGIIFDGANLWVTDVALNTVKKLDSNGRVIQIVNVGAGPELPVFDGANIWVPNFTDNSLTIVRARDGVVLATLTGNGLNNPFQAAFDGQFILVTNFSGNGVSLWKAADLMPVGSFTYEGGPIHRPIGACSDGINFWITSLNETTLTRF